MPEDTGLTVQFLGQFVQFVQMGGVVMLPQQILTECKQFTKPIDISAEKVYNSIIGRGQKPTPNIC